MFKELSIIYISHCHFDVNISLSFDNMGIIRTFIISLRQCIPLQKLVFMPCKNTSHNIFTLFTVTIYAAKTTMNFLYCLCAGEKSKRVLETGLHW